MLPTYRLSLIYELPQGPSLENGRKKMLYDACILLYLYAGDKSNIKMKNMSIYKCSLDKTTDFRLHFHNWWALIERDFRIQQAYTNMTFRSSSKNKCPSSLSPKHTWQWSNVLIL